ncbi:MAG: terminase family protein [Acidobacteria bacterium]|nr:terminase family protein [Acidobacteriota bacterium]
MACSRQWGKSTLAAARAVQLVWTVPRSLVYVVSAVGPQSGELLRKAEVFLERLGVPFRGDGNHRLSIELPNGSRIVGVPGVEVSTRGYTVDMLIVDEAAKIDDEVYYAVGAGLATTNGKLWLLSTPYGKRGFFWREWNRAGWTRVAVPATECPRISAAFLEQQRESMGPAWFSQEYLCQFLDNGTGVFDRGLVERSVRGDVSPLVLTELAA